MEEQPLLVQIEIVRQIIREQKAFGKKPGWVFHESGRRGALSGFYQLRAKGKLPKEISAPIAKSRNARRQKSRKKSRSATLQSRRRPTEVDFGPINEMRELLLADLLLDAKADALGFELLPDPCHGQNLRVLLTRKDWEKLRQLTFRRNNFSCQFCKEQFFNKGLHCHESWKFDDNIFQQKLKGLVSLCGPCHGLIHMDFNKRDPEILKKSLISYAKRIKYSYEEIKEYFDRQLELKEYRDRFEWTLDISLLKKSGLKPTKEAMTLGVRLPENLCKPPKIHQY